jgi:hypothetical protein
MRTLKKQVRNVVFHRAKTYEVAPAIDAIILEGYDVLTSPVGAGPRLHGLYEAAIAGILEAILPTAMKHNDPKNSGIGSVTTLC